MSLSFSMLGILLMLDVCFIVNYFVVRALRRWTDENAKTERAVHSDTDFAESKKRSSDILSNNFAEFFSSINSRFQSHEETAFAWVFGSVKLDPLRVRTFPGWRPIPFNAGRLTTCIFVVLSCTLLSPDVITKQVGSSVGSLDASLCVDQDRRQGMDDLREQIEKMTNLKWAKKQSQLMADFHAALVNDTGLFGVFPYECPTRGNISGVKDDWTDNGPFFPGYCERALEAAIFAAQSRDCVEQVCDCPTMPDNAVFKVTGLADKKYCGEVCFDVPYPCPQHTSDLEDDLDNYRWQQFQRAENRRAETLREYPTSIPDNVQLAAMQTAEKIKFQVDIASYVYIGYSCLALFFPTPLHLFRAPYWIGIKRFIFGVQKPYFLIFMVAVWWGVEYFKTLWVSPDIRLYLNNLRVGDPCFVDASYLVDRQQVLNDVCTELFPLEPQWNTSALTVQDVLTEVEHFVGDCNCSYPNEYLSLITDLYSSTARQIGFNETLDLCLEGAASENCILRVPFVNQTFLGNFSICQDSDAARRLVMEAPDQEPDWYELWVASGFLATIIVKFAAANFGLALMKLADPFVVCDGEFLWMPAEFGMKIVAGGQKDHVVMEGLRDGDQALGPGYIQEWFYSKRKALYHVGLSQTVVWGFLVHLCMFNLVFAIYDQIGPEFSLAQELKERDVQVLVVCLGFAFVVAIAGICSVCYLRSLTRKAIDGRFEMGTNPSPNVEDTEKEDSD